METVPNTERHYRVVHYYPHAGHGLIKDILGENLTLEEATALAQENAPPVSEEEVVVQDQTKTGFEADIEEWTK